MLPSTLTAIKAIIAADQSIDPPARGRIVAAITNPTPPTPQDASERIVRRKEVARLLSRSLRGVDLLREQGHLKAVTMPGRERGAGFKLSSVMALIEGRAA